MWMSSAPTASPSSPILSASVGTAPLKLGPGCTRTRVQDSSSTQFLRLSVYEHPLLDITRLSSIQASFASTLPWPNQQETGGRRQGPALSIPRKPPIYSPPVSCCIAPPHEEGNRMCSDAAKFPAGPHEGLQSPPTHCSAHGARLSSQIYGQRR